MMANVLIIDYRSCSIVAQIPILCSYILLTIDLITMPPGVIRQDYYLKVRI